MYLNGFVNYQRLIKRSLRKDKSSQSKEPQLAIQLLKTKDGKSNLIKCNRNGLKLNKDNSENNKKLMLKIIMMLDGHKFKIKVMTMMDGLKSEEITMTNNDFLETTLLLFGSFSLKKVIFIEIILTF